MKFVLLILTISLSGFIQADCYLNGQSYPEGSVVGPYTCSNGQWIQ